MNLSRMAYRVVFLLLLSDVGMAASQDARLEEGFVNPGFHEKPDWFKHSFLDLQADVEEAADEGKRVLLFFHQDGCPYCAKLLNENFSLKGLVAKTQANFEVIAINLWGDREVSGLQGETTTEKTFAAAHKVMYTPTLLFLNERGQVALRINGYYPPHKFEAALDYVANHQEQVKSFRDFLRETQPIPASGKLHQQPEYLSRPLDLSLSGRKSARPLLVLMEQKQCAPCDELHQDILQRPLVQASLKQFDVAVVDVWSAEKLITPAGQSLKATDWAAQKRIHYAPSLLFFDENGLEVFRTDAFLKTFHVHAAMDYVLSGAYKNQPNFQRFVQTRADTLRRSGTEPDLME